MNSKRSERAKAKSSILTAALTITSAMEIFENIEDGDNIFNAVGKAIEGHKERGQAISKAHRELQRKKRTPER